MNSERFRHLYQTLNQSNVSRQLLAECYAGNIHFRDPFHEVHGLTELTDYFTALYSNVNSIRFDFRPAIAAAECSIERWTLYYSHPRINRGREICLEGCSELQWHNQRIVRHQDYFDGGAILYEHLPLLGWAIRRIKENML